MTWFWLYHAPIVSHSCAESVADLLMVAIRLIVSSAHLQPELQVPFWDHCDGRLASGARVRGFESMVFYL
jgi:hypothetical protein